MRFTRGISICLAVLMLFALCGCNQKAETLEQRANFANTVMNGDVFGYRDGFIYFSENRYMYEYDTQTGKTARLGEVVYYAVTSVNVTEDWLLYFAPSLTGTGTGAYYITRDGKESGELFQRGNVRKAFLDGNTWYFTDSKWLEEQGHELSQLWRKDAQTGEETLLLEKEHIEAYFLDEEYIYAFGLDRVPDPELEALLEALEKKRKEEALSTESMNGQNAAGEALSEEEEDRRWEEQKEKERQERVRIENEKLMNDDFYLLRSRKDKIAFERVDMTQKPIALFADGDDLYISNMGDWQVWHYANGMATALPITSTVYQVLDGHLIYKDQIPGKGELYGDPLKLYNLKTGEIKELAESAFYFAVLAERYIAYGVNLDGSNYRWYVYDWQTGETTEMVKPV